MQVPKNIPPQAEDLNNQIIIYQTEDGQTQVDVRMENETVWLTQAQMAELFETDRTSIVRHINNIYKDEELDRESTCAKIAQVQVEGKRTVKRSIPYFNLDMIINTYNLSTYNLHQPCFLPSTSRR
ncbi:MAG: hypothetical protein K6G73_03555 [Marinilabiliaceae bacterium]|nr:hypothetical protein [Marinilabiliaceae bacterium]